MNLIKRLFCRFVHRVRWFWSGGRYEKFIPREFVFGFFIFSAFNIIMFFYGILFDNSIWLNSSFDFILIILLFACLSCVTHYYCFILLLSLLFFDFLYSAFFLFLIYLFAPLFGWHLFIPFLGL